jgi:septum formation protein
VHKHRLILASTSPYRAELLGRLGITFSTAAPRCDEEAAKEAAKAKGLAPAVLAQQLAHDKARSIAEEQRDAFIIGADQLVELDGQVLGKPYTAERALDQLLAMRGRSHRLLTAICMLGPDGAVRQHLDVHTLSLRQLPESSLRRYISLDQPLDCAGSYKIEARGIALFSSIEGEDFTAITGLPLIKLTSWLLDAGFEL